MLEPMYLFKAGKHEHLELLKAGIVHFSPLSRFREDSTTFRGDPLEGKYVIDTSLGFFVDGIDISKLGKGFNGTLSHKDSDNVLVFCASMLSQENYRRNFPNNFSLKESFLNEMRQFGQYAVIFDHLQFIKSVKNALSGMRCNIGYRKVMYCDKNNRARMRECIKNIEEQQSDTTIYFIKDKTYQIQNEWRFIIDYINPTSALKRNEDGTLDLKIKPVSTSNIFDLETAEKP